MIRTFLTLNVAPGHAEELVRVFRDLKILELSGHQPGCLGTEIDISADRRKAVVTALWESESAYAQWTSRPDRAEMSEAISEHLDGGLTAETVGETLTVFHRVSTLDGRSI